MAHRDKSREHAEHIQSLLRGLPDAERAVLQKCLNFSKRSRAECTPDRPPYLSTGAVWGQVGSRSPFPCRSPTLLVLLELSQPEGLRTTSVLELHRKLAKLRRGEALAAPVPDTLLPLGGAATTALVLSLRHLHGPGSSPPRHSGLRAVAWGCLAPPGPCRSNNRSVHSEPGGGPWPLSEQ